MKALIMATLLLAACSAPGTTGVLPPPSIEDSRALLDEIIDAGIEGDFERLCANASGTCQDELDGHEHLAPNEPPSVATVTVHQPVLDGGSGTSGGVKFVLCGIDAADTPFESEVLVFDGGDRLLAGAAVWWLGTRVSFAPPGEAVTGESTTAEKRCP
jgi:hypothetical protein